MTIGVGGGGGGDNDDGAIKRMARKLLVADLKRQKELKQAAKSSAKKDNYKGASGGGAFSSNFNLDGDDDDGDDGQVQEGDNQTQDQNPSNADEEKKTAADKGPDTNNDDADDGVIDLSELDDGAEYLRRGQDVEDHDQNDWDNPKPALFGSDDDSSSSGASNGEVQIPEDEEQLDIDAFLSLPASQRKDIIEKAKRQQRMRSRKEFMQAAANPEVYSQVQLRNFLRSSNLNKKINEMGVKAAKGEGVDGLEGEAIASDATRRFIFTKDSDKDKNGGGSGGGRTGASTGPLGGSTLASSGAAASQLDDTPSRRHRLRRLGKHNNNATSDDDDDDDDDDIFGVDSNANGNKRGATAASGKAQPFYSSTDDDDDDEEDGGGGFLVEDEASPKQGGSPDPKRSNYKSRTHHDASGWTLDEANVFGSTASDHNGGASDDDSGGGGFLAEDTPNLSISRHGNEAKGGNSNAQMVEDEILARALQEAEDEDAVVAESVGDEEYLVGTTAHARKRSPKKDGRVVSRTSSSRSQEESDAILAAQLEAEERSQTNNIGRKSEIIGLSGTSDQQSKGKSKEGSVVLLDSDSDKNGAEDDDNDSDVEVLPPPGKRKRGGVRHKKPAVPVESPSEKDVSNESEEEEDQENDDIDWEDGNEAEFAADDDLPAETQPKASTHAQMGMDTPEELANEIDVDEGGDDDIGWQDGDDGGEEEEVEVKPAAAASPQKRTGEESISEEDGDIAWEDGEGEEDEASNGELQAPVKVDNADGSDAKAGDEIGEITDISRRNSSRRSSLSETDGEFGDEATNDFAATPSSNANMAALKHAEETAANLTDWAGRAVRRAIATHMEESGAQDSPQGTGTSATAKPLGFTMSEEVVVDDSSDASSDQELDDAINEAVAKQAAVFNEGKKPEESSVPAAPPIPQPPAPIQEALPSASASPHTTKAAAASTTKVSTAAAASSAPAMDTSLEALQMEHSQMQDELNRQQRDMDAVTDEMKEEIVQLLQLFGIPYIEAPAEAEAQACALESLGLVDGVVTEDSDAFVFGGKRVYKNIFDDQKYVECYVSSDAQRDLGLAHNHMIALAMLLGGDYTEGVKGVGIVNGMEVLQAFDVSADIKSGLTKFRQWLDGFEPTDNVATRTPAEKEFHNKHRSARNRWIAPKDFPSPSVLTAYQKPVVDKSDARFSWGLPDIEALRIFCARKLAGR